MVKDASTWPFNAEQYLLLNIAIEPSINANFTQSAMEIDYVRVYELTPTSTQNVVESKTPKYFPNPVNDKLTIVLEETIQENIMINIHSIDGKLVKIIQENINDNTFVINGLSDLNKGLYFVTFRTKKQNYNLKFVK